MTGFTRHTLDFHCAVVNFRHFEFKQALDKPRMCPRDEQQRALAGLAHFHDIDLHAVTKAQIVLSDLFVGDQGRLCALFFGHADFQNNAAVARVKTTDLRAEQIMLLGGKLLIFQSAFRLAYALDDDLFGRLRRDASKVTRYDVLFNFVPELGVVFERTRLFKAQFRLRVFDHFHDGLGEIHAHFFFDIVEFYCYVFSGTGMIASKRRNQRLCNFLLHELTRDAFFFFYLRDGIKEFGVHDVQYLPCLGRVGANQPVPQIIAPTAISLR